MVRVRRSGCSNNLIEKGLLNFGQYRSDFGIRCIRWKRDFYLLEQVEGSGMGTLEDCVVAHRDDARVDALRSLVNGVIGER